MWLHLFLYMISARQTSKLTEFKRPSTSLPFNKLWRIPPPHCGRQPCLGVKIRIEGQVLSQAARLISSVHRQPARKTLKSVMLTSCNTVTLYRQRKERWEVNGGRGEAGTETEQEGWKEMLTKRKIPNIHSRASNVVPILPFPHSDCIKIIPG